MILLLLYECSLSSVDNQWWWGHSTLLAVKKKLFKFLYSQATGMLKLWLQTLMPTLASKEPPGGSSTTLLFVIAMQI